MQQEQPESNCVLKTFVDETHVIYTSILKIENLKMK